MTQPNQHNNGHLGSSMTKDLPVATDKSSVRMTMTDASESSFNENGSSHMMEELDFYAGALKKTQGIYDD